MTALLFISYDALASNLQLEAHQKGLCLTETCCAFKEANVSWLQASTQENHYSAHFKLLLVPVFMVASTTQPLLVGYTIPFFVVAILLFGPAMDFTQNLEFSPGNRSLVIFIAGLNCMLAGSHEQTSRDKYLTERCTMNMYARIESILNSLMPVQVMEQLRKAPREAHPHF